MILKTLWICLFSIVIFNTPIIAQNRKEGKKKTEYKVLPTLPKPQALKASHKDKKSEHFSFSDKIRLEWVNTVPNSEIEIQRKNLKETEFKTIAIGPKTFFEDRSIKDLDDYLYRIKVIRKNEESGWTDPVKGSLSDMAMPPYTPLSDSCFILKKASQPFEGTFEAQFSISDQCLKEMNVPQATLFLSKDASLDDTDIELKKMDITKSGELIIIGKLSTIPMWSKYYLILKVNDLTPQAQEVK